VSDAAKDAVTRDTFFGGRRRSEAHVQIALFGGKFAERPDGHYVFELRILASIRRIECAAIRHRD